MNLVNIEGNNVENRVVSYEPRAVVVKSETSQGQQVVNLNQVQQFSPRGDDVNEVSFFRHVNESRGDFAITVHAIKDVADSLLLSARAPRIDRKDLSIREISVEEISVGEEKAEDDFYVPSKSDLAKRAIAVKKKSAKDPAGKVDAAGKAIALAGKRDVDIEECHYHIHIVNQINIVNQKGCCLIANDSSCCNIS